jgi:adenylate cyclase
VLPFTNLSSDPTQDYFSDGITEDIITELSRFSELFVIARNSSFQYKGKSPDIRQVSRELGVRYVLEGSIRRLGDRVRITAQLIEAMTGANRWAERYDREVKDVFAVQDEVARAIVVILAAHVNKAEVERTLLKPPALWHAYDYYLQATDMLASFLTSLNVEELHKTQRLLEHSLSIDPKYARAYATLAMTHVLAWLNPVDAGYLNASVIERAHQFARKAVQLDQNLPQAHASLGYTLVFKREHAASIAAFETAIALNPNYSEPRFAVALFLAGEPARALEAVKSHMRLDPFYPPVAPLASGAAHYMLKRYTQALPLNREAVARAPGVLVGRVWLAATYARLGRLEEARAEAAEVLRIDPNYTIDGTQRQLTAFKQPGDAEHFFDDLRKAGLPER